MVTRESVYAKTSKCAQKDQVFSILSWPRNQLDIALGEALTMGLSVLSAWKQH